VGLKVDEMDFADHLREKLYNPKHSKYLYKLRVAELRVEYYEEEEKFYIKQLEKEYDRFFTLEVIREARNLLTEYTEEDWNRLFSKVNSDLSNMLEVAILLTKIFQPQKKEILDNELLKKFIRIIEKSPIQFLHQNYKKNEKKEASIMKNVKSELIKGKLRAEYAQFEQEVKTGVKLSADVIEKGPIEKWDAKDGQWLRKKDKVYSERGYNISLDYKSVALKELYDSKNVSAEFLREITYCKLVGGVSCYGISQNPTTKNYVMVMDYMEGGNLKQYLQNNYGNKSQIYLKGKLWQLFLLCRPIFDKEMKASLERGFKGIVKLYQQFTGEEIEIDNPLKLLEAMMTLKLEFFKKYNYNNIDELEIAFEKLFFLVSHDKLQNTSEQINFEIRSTDFTESEFTQPTLFTGEDRTIFLNHLKLVANPENF
ncbi:36580_t:CDS:2, partial [Racocetra persica]